MPINHTHSLVEKRKLRVRSKIRGTAERPRLTISRSNKHTYLQVVNDENGQTLASSSDVIVKSKGTKTDRAQQAAEALSQALSKLGIKKIVVDRGPYKYHGRIKAVAEAMRAAGLEV